MAASTVPNTLPKIGIDLGTTHCCVAYLNSDNIVEIIDNKEGHRTTPSYVAFTDDNEIIGQTAKERVFKKPENVVFDAKRLIGQKFDYTLLQPDKKYNWPFKVTSDADNNPLIEVTRRGETERYKPQEISAILLKYLKTIAEERLDTEVKDAVITVPAHFNYHQRIATKEAGKLAGLNVLKIINEPTAAALAYIHKNKLSGEAKNILVFDLGGGTFDVSIVTVEGTEITVKATAGNTALGGRDFDNNLSEFVLGRIEKQYKKGLKANTLAMRRISERSERLKINLSSDKITTLDLLNLMGDEDVDFEVTRDDFDGINSHLFDSCINIVKGCLKDANMNKTEIDKIVLVGGSTRIPKIQVMLKHFFGGKQLTKGINPDEAVAYGAAVQAAMFNKGDKTEIDYSINDVTSLSLGKDVFGGLMSIIIPRNSRVPISQTRYYNTVLNNQPTTTISIYEGERSLSEYNTLIGRAILQLPPKPPGYPFKVTFYVNADGILEVSAKTADGDYTSLAIKYKKPSQKMTNDILQDAELNKVKDGEVHDVIEKWKKLRRYCTKMEALCYYNRKGITENERNTITNICRKVKRWLEDNRIKDGSPEEVSAILDKSNEIENICEPIVNSYGYYVKDICLSKFHELIIT